VKKNGEKTENYYSQFFHPTVYMAPLEPLFFHTSPAASQTMQVEEWYESWKPEQQVSPIAKYQITTLPAQSEDDKGKLTVVLDIDETLVHSEVVTHVDLRDLNNSEVFYLFTGDGVIIRVLLRPLLREFLSEASKKFELIAFTAGAQEYASGLLDRIDPEGVYFRHRLYRQHCTFQGKDMFKDLRIVNRALARTVLVDNSSRNVLLQLENGIPISSFFCDARDTALLVLYNFLEALKHDQDVRIHLGRIFQLRRKLMARIHHQQLHQEMH
jgi:CTD small phosphatase-like protein 2